jgi:hypothetical protein
MVAASVAVEPPLPSPRRAAVTQRSRAGQALVGESRSWWWRCVAQSTGTSARIYGRNKFVLHRVQAKPIL